MKTTEPNQALEPTTMAVTLHAPSRMKRASHGRGSSITFGKIMKILCIIWNGILAAFALLVGILLVPRMLLQFTDVDRYSGVCQNKMIMAGLEGLGFVLLIWIGCFCASTPRWRKVSKADRVFLAIVGFLFLLGIIGSAITDYQFDGHIAWIELIIFGATFLAFSGPALFSGFGYLTLFYRFKSRMKANQALQTTK